MIGHYSGNKKAGVTKDIFFDWPHNFVAVAHTHFEKAELAADCKIGYSLTTVLPILQLTSLSKTCMLCIFSQV